MKRIFTLIVASYVFTSLPAFAQEGMLIKNIRCRTPYRTIAMAFKYRAKELLEQNQGFSRCSASVTFREMTPVKQDIDALDTLPALNLMQDGTDPVRVSISTELVPLPDPLTCSVNYEARTRTRCTKTNIDGTTETVRGEQSNVVTIQGQYTR